ncbi:hypothetical protein CO172_00960 [Candidatus Uhrbacteria bacterium CG_4_9_14_3_um_filter_36_7]|uniref:AB hydrolase-1 domain-containing protein n=1 Tax=Candidatus Uhrbacteria bacterium CG_4_9_14_3_um_filter_36_7 TaxID=1975033 RepID=A0A2M7XI16_9BACT|nr:MAG: hypothetical protein CO172_00960 [Candidatus Uhrbacteria bacterium CG_4_9_14_3_um_filter_36_7]
MSETRPLGIEEAALREAASKETSPSLESRRFVYSKETDPGRLQEIKEKIEQSRFLRFEFEGQEIQIEYIEVEAKKTQEVHEDGVRSPVDIIIPGFCASLIPFKPTVREMAEYMPDHRIICVSPLDSGKSSALKDSSLEKMNRVYRQVFEEMGIDVSSVDLTVIAHSRSDIIGLGLAAAYPELVKNIVLVNGVSAKSDNLARLTYDFSQHTLKDITPERMKGFFHKFAPGEIYEGVSEETAQRYLEQTVDFMRNILKFPQAFHQFSSLAQRRIIDLDSLVKSLKSNVLILSGTRDITSPENSRQRIFENLPDTVQGKQSIEVGGLHDAPNADPEAFALKLAHWFKTLNKE